MFETNGSWISQQHSPLESPAFRSYMIAPVNTRQQEVLPTSVNPCRVSANLGCNEFRIPGWPEKGLSNGGIDMVRNSMLYSPTRHCTPDGSPLEQTSLLARVGERPWALETLCPQQRKFLVFDQSGNDTRLMFSSLCPGEQNLPALQEASDKQFDAFKFLPARQAGKGEEVFAKIPILSEESGENELLDEEREMREDTEEINALLYSDDYDDQDNDFDDEDEDEVSSGHSPLVKEGVSHMLEERQESDLDNEVAISSISLKRHKTLDGGHQDRALVDAMMTRKQTEAYKNIHSEDFSNAIDKGAWCTIGSKRPRKDKVCDTLKVLESILPGLKSKDPIVILDEAISYLKCLKHNAEAMSAENSNSSGCYEPFN